MKRKNLIKVSVLVVIIGTLAYLALCTPLPQHLAPERLKQDISGPYAPLIFMAAFILGLLLKVPGVAFVILGSMVFERLPAFIYSLIAITLGTSFTFFLARFLLRDTMKSMKIKGISRLDERIVRHGFLTVLLLRFIFFLLPPLNWALGVTSVRYRDYLLGTLAGVIPGVLLFSLVVGDVGKMDFRAAFKDYRLLASPFLGLFLFGIFFVIRRYLKKRLS